MKKYSKLVSVILSAFLVFSALSAAVSAAETEYDDFNIRLVHTNDIHARVQEDSKSGIIGMPKLGSIINDFTSDADMDLVLDSGDLFHGQPIATLVRGESVAQLVRACGYDAMTVGNHDWSYDKDRLKKLCNIADLTMLTGNVISDDSGSKFFDEEFYTESITVDGKELKVGVFGVVDPKIKSSTTPSNVEGLTFIDSVKYANEAATNLKQQNCDIIIALTHTYFPDELASQVNGVDLWLAGHEHIQMDKIVTTPNGKQTRVIESGYYLYGASLLTLTGSLDKNGDVVNLHIDNETVDYRKAANYSDNEEVAAVLSDILAEQQVKLGEVVGSTPEYLDGIWEDLRIDETNLGRAVTDSYLLATGADVAFENAGGIRASVNAGDVTYSDILGVSPYGNYIVTKQITGKELKEIFEISLEIQMQCREANDSGIYDAWPQSSGSYLQAGGAEVYYDCKEKEGSRVSLIKVGGEDLEEDRLYTVASNNYVVVSEYYPQLAGAEETGEYCACEEALIAYFSQDVDEISKSINTPRLKEISDYPIDEDPTDSPEITVPTESTEPTTEPDLVESSTTSSFVQITTNPATVDEVSKVNKNDSGAIQTGAKAVMAGIIFILMCVAAYAVVKTSIKH